MDWDNVELRVFSTDSAPVNGLFTSPGSDVQTLSLVPRGRDFALREDPQGGKVKWTIKVQTSHARVLKIPKTFYPCNLWLGFTPKLYEAKITRRKFLSHAGVAAATFPFASSILKVRQRSLLLWYDKPASEWTEALPIGNGRLGAMIFGGTAVEQLQLNEDTLYAGSPYDPNNPEALKALPEARRLIFEGKYKEAHDLVGAKMMAQPIKQMPYEPVGDLKLLFADHENISNYRRQLDLNTAIATTSYNVGVTTFTREIFASPVDQVIVVCLTADRLRRLNFAVTFETPQTATVATEGRETLVLSGVNGDSSGIKGGLKFESRVLVLAQGGQTLAEKERIVVSNA